MKGIKILITVMIFITCSCHKQDVTPPVITLNGDENINIELYENYEEKGATAMDDVDGDLTSLIQKTNNIISNALGKYNVVYTVTDKSGNTALKYRYVNVIYITSTDTLKNDTIAPVITLKGQNQIYIKNGNQFNDPGATAIDNIYGDLTPFITTTNNVNTMMNGTYSVTYSVSDFSGNSASKTRTVIVLTDNTPPVITLYGPNPQHLQPFTTYVDPGVSAWDALDGDRTAFIQKTNNINNSVWGTYTVTYKVSDLSGNQATATRTVIVGPN